MIHILLGTKKGMTSTYDSRGRRVGATIVEVTPNAVTQVKTADSADGYNAVQLGFGTKKSVKKPQLGTGKKAGIERPIRWFREVRVEATEDLQPGTEINLSQVFSIGDSIRVTGTSKGKGFQGGVRRHGFHGGPKTHGQSDRHRAPGSIGSGTTPGRVYRGKKMAGHMGNETASARNLEVVGIDKDKNLITIKGAVPGSVGGLIMLTKLGRIKGYTPPPEEKVDEEEEAQQAESQNQEKIEEQITNEQPTIEGTSSEAPVEEAKGEENAS